MEVSFMNKKATGIVAYITIIGWIIAFLAGDKEGAKVHLNQGLVLAILGIIGSIFYYIPLVGWIIALVIRILVLVFAIMGICYAATDKDQELPVIGAIHLLK